MPFITGSVSQRPSIPRSLEGDPILPPPHAPSSLSLKSTLVSLKQEGKEEYTDRLSPLEVQSKKLAGRASRYLALSATEILMDLPEPLSEEQKQDLLTSTNFSCDLDDLLKKNPPSFFRKSLLRMCVIPFCQKIAPSFIEAATNTITNTFLTICTPHAPFPKEVMSQKLHNLSSYFSVLHSALKRAAQQEVVTGGIEEQIAEELEKAQSTQYSSPQLYTKAIESCVDFAILFLEEKLQKYVQESHFLIRYPGQVGIKTSFFFFRLGITPFFWVGQLWLNYKLKERLSHKLQIDPASLPSGLTSPFISFANRLLMALFKNIQSHQDTSTISPIDIDSESLRNCIKQQILLQSLCSCTMDTTLRSAMEDSTFQRLIDQLLDKYALDEIIKSVHDLLSIVWQTATQENLIEDELHELLLSLNEGLVYGTLNKTDIDELKKTASTISLYLTSQNIHTTLHGIEDRVDKTLSFWSEWPAKKTIAAKTISSWIGLDQPIKTALANRLIPLVDEMSNRAVEKLVQFWTIPYNLRYGLLHYQILLPYLT